LEFGTEKVMAILRIRGADVLANTRVDSIGTNNKICPFRASICKLNADIIITFQQNPRKLFLIMNNDLSLPQHHQKLVNQHLSIYSKTLIPIQFLVTKIVLSRGLAIFVLERQSLEIEAFVSNPLVHAQVIEDARAFSESMIAPPSLKDAERSLNILHEIDCWLRARVRLRP
jgi:hypothetical protein